MTMQSRREQGFPPIVYAILAALVLAGFAIAGEVSWWWVAVGPVCIYASERFWQARRSR